MSIAVLAFYAAALIQPRDPQLFTREMLRLQNAPRAQLGLQPLQWDESLAGEAAQYAAQLAISGRFEHSHRPGQGENLWMGTRYAFTYRQMVDSWTGEASAYRSGVFPRVSASGNWTDVGHYTQVVWQDTKSVGCGLATGLGNDVLVCRYFPAGNVIGQWAYERPNPRLAILTGEARPTGFSAASATARLRRPSTSLGYGYRRRPEDGR